MLSSVSVLVMRDKVISSLLSEDNNKLKRRVGDLETTLRSILPFLVQVQEDREVTTAGQKTSIQLSVSSQYTCFNSQSLTATINPSNGVYWHSSLLKRR